MSLPAQTAEEALRFVTTDGSASREGNGTEKLDALSRISRRAADIKAALKEVQARQRAQERADRRRLEALIGEALLADVEAAEGEERSRRKACISEALARFETSAVEIAFLKAKKWWL